MRTQVNTRIKLDGLWRPKTRAKVHIKRDNTAYLSKHRRHNNYLIVEYNKKLVHIETLGLRNKELGYVIVRNDQLSQLTSQKKVVIEPSTFYLWVYMLRDPKFWLTDPKFCGEFESELRSGFRARNGELKGSVFFG